MVPIDQINALEEKNKELLNNLVRILSIKYRDNCGSM